MLEILGLPVVFESYIDYLINASGRGIEDKSDHFGEWRRGWGFLRSFMIALFIFGSFLGIFKNWRGVKIIFSLGRKGPEAKHFSRQTLFPCFTIKEDN